MGYDDSEPLLCSFCGKSQNEVSKIIAGPGAYICDECVVLSMEIVNEEAPAGQHENTISYVNKRLDEIEEKIDLLSGEVNDFMKKN